MTQTNLELDTNNKKKKSLKVKLISTFLLGCLLGISSGVLATVSSLKYFSGPELQIPIDTKTAIDNIRNNIKDSFADAGKYNSFDEIRSILKTNYYYEDKLDFDKSAENAKKGFIDAIGDPFTTYFTKKEASDFEDDLKGSENFEGIGAVVSKKDDGVMIEEIIKGAPAFKAGLLPLDVIIEVNGESIKTIPLQEVVDKKLRGPKGSEVELTIYRDSEKKVFKQKLKREAISIPSTSGKIIQLTGNKNIGYIEISKFGEDTEQTMEKVINELKGKEIKGIILDLRGNGGGIVPISVEIGSHFIPKDKVIVQTKYKSLPGETLKSYGYGEYEGKPIVILVDGMTASASEIIALALKQQVGAKTVGTKTFGKGSIQTIYNFKDGSSFKYTIGRWYSPNGDTIDKVGIQPDIKIEPDTNLFKEKNIDNQLEKAKETLSSMIK